MTICGYPPAQIISWSTPKPTLNTRKSPKLLAVHKIQILTPHRQHNHVIAWSARISELKSDERSRLQYWRNYNQVNYQTTSDVENEERQNANLELHKQHDQYQQYQGWLSALTKRQARWISHWNWRKNWNAFKSVVFKESKEKLGTAANTKTGSTETAWSWKNLSTTGTSPGITSSA